MNEDRKYVLPELAYGKKSLERDFGKAAFDTP